MRTVEVGKPTRAAQDQLIVKCRIEARCRVRGARKRIGGLEVTVAGATRERGLKGMVVGVGVIGKDFETRVTVNSLVETPRHGIRNRICGNDELLAVGATDSEWVLRADQY